MKKIILVLTISIFGQAYAQNCYLSSRDVLTCDYNINSLEDVIEPVLSINGVYYACCNGKKSGCIEDTLDKKGNVVKSAEDKGVEWSEKNCNHCASVGSC